MRFQVFGQIGAYDHGGAVGLGGPRQRAVLARLLVSVGTVVSLDTLIDDLYGDAPPPSAVATIQAYVSNLRRALEPRRAPRAPARLLIGRPPGYLLAAPGAAVDAVRFTELVERSEARPPAEALAMLDEALELWTGSPYGEFASEPWTMVEVNRLCELRLVAVERRAQARLDLGRPQAAISELEAEVAGHALRERLWYLLALALYRTGRQGDALSTLGRVRDLLADQLGLDPGPTLRALEKDILRQAGSLMPSPAGAAVLTRAAPRPAAPYGRERQLAGLEALLERDGLSVAAVSGEPGIGKTRLLEAFAERCADLGRTVLWGRCPETEGAPPLGPWLQVLRALDRLHPALDSADLNGLMDDEAPPGSTAAARLRRHQALAGWLRAAARTRPLVIVLDDLHWADSASLSLLGDVAALLGGEEAQGDDARVTLVIAFRDGPERLPLGDVLGRLTRHDLLRLPLTGLGVEQVRAIAADMGAEIDEPTAVRLAERTGGNPFFARETARALAHGGTLDAVPDAVADLIRRRVGALGRRAAEVLGAAAVIGRDFDPGVLAQVCGQEVYDPLDRAAQAGLVAFRVGRMAFAHDLIRETLLHDVPPLRRALIHREAMAAFAERPGADVAVIAHHALEAGPAAYAEAARWARAAAEQASLRLAYHEAASWWGQAVRAHGASSGDPLDHVELLLRQVRALLDTGDPIGARAARAQAILAADRATGRGDRVSVVRALTALEAPAVWTLRNPYEEVELKLVRRFEIALGDLPADDGPERAELLSGLAQELYDGTDDRRRDRLSAEAVQIARRLGDPHLLMRMLNARHLALTQSIHAEELLEIATELLDLAVGAHMPEYELLAYMLLTHDRLEMADVAGADAAAARCDAILARLPLPWPRFQHTMWRANRLTLAGRHEAAAAMYDEAEEQADRLGMWYAGAVVATGRILLHHHRGDIAEAGPLIDSIAGIHATMDHDTRILQLCAQGRAREAAATVRDGWPVPPLDWSWLTMTCLQGAAQAALRDLPACRATYATLLPYAGRISVGSAIALAGPVDRYLALLAGTLGDQEAADRHLSALARLEGDFDVRGGRE
ncbi:AfsR/SARP family transcriptional regulator [Sphaerisporangium fuscum]|uniref:AfsR/SARP family transcriptional regulator n=1 Tax=Sphaerisporangium fuscum TaxID=2835868 RepID=UPI001BDD9E7F|nr:AfsR/SARP family transcriptional regulator [Sphaerisporangium fuscum]